MTRSHRFAGGVSSWLIICVFPALFSSSVVAAADDSPPVSPQAGQAEAAQPDSLLFKPAYKFPIFDEIRETREAKQAVRDSLRKLVDEWYKAKEKHDEDSSLTLRFGWQDVDQPANPEAFASAFHFPPQSQYSTGTCWAFSGTSFFESEAKRLTGREIKLSEMWPVYWEWVEMTRRYVQEYGHTALGPGSQCDGVREIYRKYGAVPAAAYPGILDASGRHDHDPMVDKIYTFLNWVKANNYWDEQNVVSYVRGIMDEHMGPPPTTFKFEGRTYTPVEFRSKVLKVEPDDYIEIISTMRQPFNAWAILDVHDNWRRRHDFLNLPLDDFYRVIKTAVQNGYTVTIGGDVSEPGEDGMEGAAVVPSFDIPTAYIDQRSRELRMDNETTTDDHGLHAVGYVQHAGRDWFLIKDSSRRAQLGQFKGYFFFDGDYIRLKMLSAMVHKDRLTGLLPAEPPEVIEEVYGTEVFPSESDSTEARPSE